MTTITIVMTCKLNIELVGGAVIRGLVRLVNSACVCVWWRSGRSPSSAQLFNLSITADRGRLIVWGNSVRLCKRFWQEVTDRWASVSETKSRRNRRLKQIWCCCRSIINPSLILKHWERKREALDEGQSSLTSALWAERKRDGDSQQFYSCLTG